MKLHLGIVEFPYSGPPGGHQAGQQPTTVDVAQWLEKKYHVMEVFATLHYDDIATAVTKSWEGAVRSLLQGAPVTLDPGGAAMSSVKQQFTEFLDLQEMDGLGVPGVPTLAAQRGVQTAKKLRRGAPRPSFIDTGLYRSSFLAWMD